MRTSVAAGSRIVAVAFALTAFGVTGAALVWSREGRSVILSEPGKVGSSKVRMGFQPHDLAVSASGAILYVSDTCRKNAEIRFRGPDGREKEMVGLNKIFAQWAQLLESSNGRVNSLALSPSGKIGAFVLRPCTPEGVGEVSEHVGVVYVISTNDMRVRILQGSLDESGRAAGMAMDLKFSPDEKGLLVNYEGDFAVFDVETGEQVFGSNTTFVPPDRWTNAIGWISNSCIAFRTAHDGLTPDARAPMVINTRSRELRPLGEVTGSANERLMGFEDVNSEYGLRRRLGKWEVVSLQTGNVVLLKVSVSLRVGFAAAVEGARYDFCAVRP